MIGKIHAVFIDETPGTTQDGEHYEAIQRNIRYNHLAIVPKGRAGTARLNMDGEQDFCFYDDGKEDEETMGDKMTKVRLDSGIEYDCAAEVKVELEKMRTDKAKAAKQFDTLQAKYDALEADLKKEREGRKADEEARTAKFDAAVKERVSLLNIADKHKIEKADGMTDKEIKIAVIKSVRGDNFNLDGKIDDYIAAAFDLCRADTKKHEEGLAKQREAVNKHKIEPGETQEQAIIREIQEEMSVTIDIEEKISSVEYDYPNFRNHNNTLAESETNGGEIHLFEVFEATRYVYQGVAELAGKPYHDEQLGDDNKLRKVWMFPVRRKNNLCSVFLK